MEQPEGETAGILKSIGSHRKEKRWKDKRLDWRIIQTHPSNRKRLQIFKEKNMTGTKGQVLAGGDCLGSHGGR